ncbi:HAMP domain-containing histidine kinase, partial [bacterium]|nr:HAMP domain-containing histidine kinase [bacterium]
LLAREAGEEMQQRLEEEGEAGEDTVPLVAREMEIIVRKNENIMVVCFFDPEGNLVLSHSGMNPDMIRMRRSDEGHEASFDISDFDHIEVLLKDRHPLMRSIEVPVVRHDTPVGSMRLLISESAIYRDLELTAGQITRHLWSALLAFFGVLALGLYLTARLFKRQMFLMQENERLDRMAYVGTLASGLAHEIRNPLNAMAVNLSVADEELAAGEAGSTDLVRRAIKLLRREADRLNQSVTNFMQFARPDMSRCERTRLQPVVDEVLELLAPQLVETQTRVEVNLPDDNWLKADFSGLRQVLYNIVLNALQAMADKTPAERRRIEIGGRRESAQWLLWVQDSGPGVAEGEVGRIFEVFHTTKAAGSGFGLSIARAIIDSHGGEISARNAETGGLRVEVTLPETGKQWR